MQDARPYERRSARMAKADREAQLIAIAERLFIERGYAETSIEDVAQAARVTRPVVYNHFGSKEGLYVACVRRAREQLRERILERLSRETDPREQIRVGGDVFFELIEADPRRWLVLFGGSAVPLFGEHGEALTDLRMETVAGFAALIQAAYPEAEPQRVRAVAHAISGVGEQLGRWWLREPEMSRETLAGYYADFIWNGVQQLVAGAQPATGVDPAARPRVAGRGSA